MTREVMIALEDEYVWKMEIKGKDGTLGILVVSNEEPEAPVSLPLSYKIDSISTIPTFYRVLNQTTRMSTRGKAPSHRLAPKSSARLTKNPYHNLVRNFWSREHILFGYASNLRTPSTKESQ